MTSAAAHPSDDTSPLPSTGGARGRRRLVLAAAAVVIVAVGYLALSLVAPRTVPRLAALPKPADRVAYEDCDGQPGAKTTERWERSGAFWVLTTFHLGGACITR